MAERSKVQVMMETVRRELTAVPRGKQGTPERMFWGILWNGRLSDLGRNSTHPGASLAETIAWVAPIFQRSFPGFEPKRSIFLTDDPGLA